MDRCIGGRLILLATIAWGAGTARAYPTPVDFDGTLQRWDVSIDAPEVSFRVQGDVEALESQVSLVETAAEMWTDVAESYVVLRPAEDGEREQVLVVLKDSITGGAMSAGFAIFDEKDNAGRPVHCRIEIGSAESMGYLAFAKTALHELGHCIGLGHSMVPEAIMGYELESNAFALDTDDIAAAARLYPTDGSKPELPPGCGVGTHAKHGRPWLLYGLFLLPVVVGMIVNFGRAFLEGARPFS